MSKIGGGIMENYKFYSNKQCEYFPCHKTSKPEEFNCMFCYCPLYALGDKCGGNYKYLESGIKSCEDCMIPHGSKGFEIVMSHMKEVMEIAKK